MYSTLDFSVHHFWMGHETAGLYFTTILIFGAVSCENNILGNTCTVKA